MASRCFCACVLAAGTVAGAQAAQPAAVDEGAIALDQAVQALKDEAVQFNRDALIAEEAFLYPPQTRLSVYLSNKLPNLLLSQVVVTVDNRPPVTYRYGDKDSRALLKAGALQRLVLTNVDRGIHRLQVQYSGQFMDGNTKTEPLDGQFEAKFDKGLESAEIELQLQRARGRHTAAMSLKEWRAAEE